MDPQDDNVTNTSRQDTNSSAEILINMESLIKSHLSAIARLETELDKFKAMLEDIFENDPTYKEHSEKAKEANKIKQGTKKQILKQPQVADLSNRVKNLQAETKEHKASLSDYLKEYQRLSGLSEIEGEDGTIHQIIYEARLIKKFV